MIRDIGAAAGAPDKADSLNKGIRARIDAIRAASMDHKPTVLLIIGRTPGLLTNLVAAAPSTYLSELLQIAGGSNALNAGAISYPHISLETVVRLDPDIILDMSMMGESTEPLVREERLRQPWFSHRELKAVRSGNVFGLASEILVTPGPRVVEAVEEIKAKIHTESRSKVQR
jgi:iron complex transport system substrate-binding protein